MTRRSKCGLVSAFPTSRWHGPLPVHRRQRIIRKLIEPPYFKRSWEQDDGVDHVRFTDLLPLISLLRVGNNLFLVSNAIPAVKPDHLTLEDWVCHSLSLQSHRIGCSYFGEGSLHAPAYKMSIATQSTCLIPLYLSQGVRIRHDLFLGFSRRTTFCSTSKTRMHFADCTTLYHIHLLTR